MQLPDSLLVGARVGPRDRATRAALVIVWLGLVAWLLCTHTFWRDEVRAFSLALSGANVVDMLRNVHGEGHPALWYLMLRGGHWLFPCREVLPVTAAVVGIAAMALFAFRSPFRTVIVALVLFSLYGAFEYVVMARNYGISALVMFALAPLYSRVRDTLWLGLFLAVLCNTNVPSCMLAAAFVLFRFVEMLTAEEPQGRRQWLIFAGNALLALAGAALCFVTVYPTFNQAAVSPRLGHLSAAEIATGLFDSNSGFLSLGLRPSLLSIACLGLIRKPAALIAGLVALFGLNLFFYLIYPSAYRHEVLYLVFLIALYWIALDGAGGSWPNRRWMAPVQLAGTCFFIAVLGLQCVLLGNAVIPQAKGVPFSRSADVAKLLRRPQLSGAIVMADPDTMLEALPYYTDNPLWFLRQQRFGKVTALNDARRILTLDDVLADAERLHRQTGRPVVFLSPHELRPGAGLRYRAMFNDETVVTPDGVDRFLSATRFVATLRPAVTDEQYGVYVYPR